MREYSKRFLIAMIIGICVLLLFITGRSDQSAMQEKATDSSWINVQKRDDKQLITIQKHKMDI